MAVSNAGKRAFGIGFIAVVVGLIGLSVATFEKVFTDVVLVSLRTDRVGSQLKSGSDVKIRGLIVGEVRDIVADDKGATLHLALDPALVGQIPSNVSARLLPKTLFGERFVDLVAPERAARPIRAGDLIPQDRTTVAIELEQVFDDLLPLLRAVKPEKLATTLNALATTLDGRGEQIGENIVVVDDYFKRLNPEMPVIKADISGLADLASTYEVAGPELLRAAKALLTTNATIVEKKDELAGFLAGTAGFANHAAGFLEANQDRLIQLGQVQRPTLALLAKHSPIYPCFAQGLVNWLPRADGMFAGGQMHITLETAPQTKPYHPGEEPRWGDKRAPDCKGLPNAKGSQAHPRGGSKYADGTDGSPTYANSALPQAFLGASGASIPNADSGLSGTADEQAIVSALLTPGATGDASLTTLLAGPMLRGSVVSSS